MESQGARSANGESVALVIRGLGGYLDGVTRRLRWGEAVTVGRSRHCGVSLKEGRRFREGAREECLRDPNFLRVSRRHLEIAFPHKGIVEIRNLSRNGIRLNGKGVDRVMLTDLDSCRIEFGGGEILTLGWEKGESKSPGPK